MLVGQLLGPRSVARVTIMRSFTCGFVSLVPVSQRLLVEQKSEMEVEYQELLMAVITP